MTVNVVIVEARLHRPVDGDTYDLLCNFLRRSTWRHAQVIGVRLRGYRAREHNQGAELDPATGDVLRVSGVDATRIAVNYLTQSSRTLVEFTGTNSLDREVCDVWVTVPGQKVPQPFGAVLLAARAVIPGNTMGDQPAAR